VVFLVLAVTWVVVLTFWFRARSQPSFSDSVSQFHRHLRVIERAAPTTMPAANRLRGPVAATPSLGPMLSTAVAEHELIGTGGIIPDQAASASDPMRSFEAVRRGAAYRDQVATNRRRRVQRRRRDVLIVLAAVAVGTLVLTLVDRIPDAALAQIVSDVILAGYILLLARARTAGVRRSARGRRHSVRPLRRLRVPRPSRVGASLPGDAWGTYDAWDIADSGDTDASGDTAGEGDDVHLFGGGWDSADDDDDTAGFDAAILRQAVSR
jgi:hypothetical protein